MKNNANFPLTQFPWRLQLVVSVVDADLEGLGDDVTNKRILGDTGAI